MFRLILQQRRAQDFPIFDPDASAAGDQCATRRRQLHQQTSETSAASRVGARRRCRIVHRGPCRGHLTFEAFRASFAGAAMTAPELREPQVNGFAPFRACFKCVFHDGLGSFKRSKFSSFVIPITPILARTICCCQRRREMRDVALTALRLCCHAGWVSFGLSACKIKFLITVETPRPFLRRRRPHVFYVSDVGLH
jgi:hypothetical protein